MTSLVSDVLCPTSGTLDRNNLQNEINRISHRMESLKLQVQSVLHKCYIEFDPLVASAFETEDNLHQLEAEAKALRNKIDKELRPHLNSAVLEYEDLAQCVKRTNILADVLHILVTVWDALQGSKNALISKKYLIAAQLQEDAMEHISRLESAWNMASSDGLHLLESLRTMFIVQRENLTFSLGQVWSQHIVWVDKVNSTFLRVYAMKDSSASGFIQACEFLDDLLLKLKVFSKNFMVHFVRPILRQESEVLVNRKSLYLEVEVTVKGSQQPRASDVLKTLESLFEYLSEAFAICGATNAEVTSLMQNLGKVCAEEFCSSLIKECLEPAVPSQSKDFDAYRTVSAHVGDFESFLKNIGFLSSEHFLSYTQNFETLFASRRSQEILVKARETMKEDLHAMMSSDDVIASGKVKNGPIQQCEKQDDLKHAFVFPKCQISLFADKILSQLHEVLTEASLSSSKEMALRLILTARHLSQMYCDMVPIYHEQSIIQFPQQTAVHHNNCMFLAHYLMTLFHGYDFHLRQKGVQGLKTFVDIALQLRTIGTEAFLHQMRRQRTVLLEFLQDGGVFQNMSSEELLFKGSRAVKQCLVHLQSLKKLWLPVLPREVYLRSVGTLCNSCLEEIIFRIVSQDDITEKTNQQLNTILSTLDKEVPKLFDMPDNHEADESNNPSKNKCKSGNEEADWRVLCTRHIKKWAKFQELKILLKSSLVEIVERWSSGQGPLANEATAEEVKQLIRALFQNTDRRAAALAKIK